jgi:hypothetical protein
MACMPLHWSCQTFDTRAPVAWAPAADCLPSCVPAPNLSQQSALAHLATQPDSDSSRAALLLHVRRPLSASVWVAQTRAWLFQARMV